MAKTRKKDTKKEKIAKDKRRMKRIDTEQREGIQEEDG